QVRRPVLGVPLVEDLDDVGVRELLRRFRLATETLADDGVATQPGGHDLDRTWTIDELVASTVDGGHAPLAEHLFDDVAPRQRGADARILQVHERLTVHEAKRAFVRVPQVALLASLHAPAHFTLGG